MAGWPYNTKTWRQLRLTKLREQPLCEACQRRGAYVPAQDVDHIVSITSGGDPFPPLSGLTAMCHRCHSQKTAAMDRAGGSGIRYKGAGADGLPVDPDHPFFGRRDTPLEGRRAEGAVTVHSSQNRVSSRPKSKKPRTDFDGWA